MNKIFGQLASEDHLADLSDAARFASRAARYIAEINAVHPFREGNGRCQFTLLDILLNISGFEMDEAEIDPSEFMHAMIASFHGDNGPLSHCILKMIE